jgi:hypothetical protein
METQTAFDLNLAVQRWREDLENSPALRCENVNELESHLRDSAASLQTGGLSAEEAFLIATRRIGKSQQLESEFGKLNRNSIWLGRILWMLIGLQLWPLVEGLVSGTVGYVFELGWRKVSQSPIAGGAAWPILFAMLFQLPALLVAAWLAWLVLRKSGALVQRIAAKLPDRFTFVTFCICGSALLCLLHWLITYLTVAWYNLALNAPGHAEFNYLAYSQTFMGFLRTVGFVILTLLLVRKQLVEKRA